MEPVHALKLGSARWLVRMLLGLVSIAGLFVVAFICLRLRTCRQPRTHPQQLPTRQPRKLATEPHLGYEHAHVPHTPQRREFRRSLLVKDSGMIPKTDLRCDLSFSIVGPAFGFGFWQGCLGFDVLFNVLCFLVLRRWLWCGGGPGTWMGASFVSSLTVVGQTLSACKLRPSPLRLVRATAPGNS
jgi:hypothetical protein